MSVLVINVDDDQKADYDTPDASKMMPLVYNHFKTRYCQVIDLCTTNEPDLMN